MALHNLDWGEKSARPIKRSKRKDKKLWIEQGEYEGFKEMDPEWPHEWGSRRADKCIPVWEEQ